MWWAGFCVVGGSDGGEAVAVVVAGDGADVVGVDGEIAAAVVVAVSFAISHLYFVVLR